MTPKATLASVGLLAFMVVAGWNQLWEQRQKMMYDAAYRGDVPRLRLLLALGAEPNELAPARGRPLVAACWKGHRGAAELLLDHGADVNQVEKLGMTGLIAAAANGHADVADLLLSRGADARRVSEAGTALSIAWQRGDAGMLILLAQHGISEEGR